MLASTSSPTRILKTESSFAHKNGKTVGQGKKIIFADEVGQMISQNNYVEQLHYSHASYIPGEGPGSGCGCTLN